MREIPVKKVGRAAVITSLGFLIAILGNLFIPQVAELKIEQYRWGPFLFNLNSFYRTVLGGIILIYLIAGVLAVWKPERRPKFVKQQWFRFAMGIVLLAYDIAGTKLRITPQPFFPGPAEVLKTFMDDGPYLMQNTLYSLRLFAVGFGIGIVLGLVTGVIIGWFPKAYYWLYPVIRITGVIPAVAWMPFALTISRMRSRLLFSSWRSAPGSRSRVRRRSAFRRRRNRSSRQPEPSARRTLISYSTWRFRTRCRRSSTAYRAPAAIPSRSLSSRR